MSTRPTTRGKRATEFLIDMYRQSARLVDRIIKGTKPGGLAFELPTRYELIVNLKTAKAMGLTILDVSATRRRGDRVM